MPKGFQRSLQDYLSKVKVPTQFQIHPKPITTCTKNWIFSGCKHPKTPSFALDHEQIDGRNGDAATLRDVDRFLIENFGSLYRDNNNNNNNNDNTDNKKKGVNNEENSNGFLFESPRFIDPPPDIRASHRFFVSPSTSSSLVEEAQSSGGSIPDDLGSSSNITHNESIRVSTEVNSLLLPDESIAVLKYSSDPFDDFRRSMQAMIEVRLCENQCVDWDYMEELLFCYLRLNERKSHKYILGAFSDLIVKLRQNTSKNPAMSCQIPVTGERRRRRRRKGDVM